MEGLVYHVQATGLISRRQLPFLLQLIPLLLFWNAQMFFVRGVLCFVAVLGSLQIYSMTLNFFLLLEGFICRVFCRRELFQSWLFAVRSRLSLTVAMFALEMVLFTGSEPLRWFYSCVLHCMMTSMIDYGVRWEGSDWNRLNGFGRLLLCLWFLSLVVCNALAWSFLATAEVKSNTDTLRAWFILIVLSVKRTMESLQLFALVTLKTFGATAAAGSTPWYSPDSLNFRIGVSVLAAIFTAVGSWEYTPSTSSFFYQFAILRYILEAGRRMRALKRFNRLLENIEDGEGVEGDQCPICLEEFERRTKVKRLTCGHTFHSDCLRSWLNRNWSCPVCRRRSARQPTRDDAHSLQIHFTAVRSPASMRYRSPSPTGRRAPPPSLPEEDRPRGHPSSPFRTQGSRAVPPSTHTTGAHSVPMTLPQGLHQSGATMTGFVQPLVPRMGMAPPHASPSPSSTASTLYERVQEIDRQLALLRQRRQSSPSTPRRATTAAVEDDIFTDTPLTTAPAPSLNQPRRRRVHPNNNNNNNNNISGHDEGILLQRRKRNRDAKGPRGEDGDRDNIIHNRSQKKSKEE